MKLFLSLTLGAALALAACNSGTKRETGGTAGGEILPASVSDAMLPHDTVRSQAPLAPSAAASAAATDEPEAGSAEEAEGEAEPAVAPAAAAEPAAVDAE